MIQELQLNKEGHSIGSAAIQIENSCVSNGIDQHDSNRAFVMTCT